MGEILLIILSVLIFVTLTVIVILLARSRKTTYRSDVHFSGGADIDTGRLSNDSSYFKGVTSAELDTVYIRKPKNADLKHKLKIRIVNLSDSSSGVFSVPDSITIGRTGIGSEINLHKDLMVSKQHCRLSVNSGCVYLEDLNSANHTYLNGRLITSPIECRSGDVIGVGNTQLQIFF